MFGHLRSTMISLLIGGYATAAIVFPCFKALYDLGIPAQYMFLIWAGGSVFVVLNCFFNIPRKIIFLSVIKLGFKSLFPKNYKLDVN